MKLFLASDLHVEFHGNAPDAAQQADIILLAGDCHSGERTFEVAEHYHQRYDVPVVFVAGNHEFYGHDIDQLIERLRAKSARHPGIHFLERDSIVIGSTRFLGCTLWSNFLLFGQETQWLHKAKAADIIPDFRLIKKGEANFSAEDAEQLFNDSYEWLDHTLAQPFVGHTVVLTHFAPDICAVHPHFLQAGRDELTPYFTNDCTDLMRRHSIHTWCYGHTHNSVDQLIVNKTRVVSNQRGYPHEPAQFTAFDSNKIIELD
ncbi:MAG TPA: metallophosphoesterase [Pseudomonadales bacterium]|nr:metallophosphoesterase [Pseudomonadales bacterium]